MSSVTLGAQRRMTRAQGWTLALTSVATFLVGLDALVVATALSAIRTHLGASIEELEWTVNAYSLSFAVLLMTGAALGDRFGRRRMFMAGVVLFGLASAFCALAPSVGWLITARALQGSGAALAMPLALTLLSEAFPPEQRGRALGLFSGIAGLAVLSGPVVGGAVVQGLNWQWIFWLNVPICVVALPLIRLRVRESYGPRTPLDIGGLLLVTGVVFGFVWGLVRGNASGWGSVEVVGSLVAGAVLTVALVYWELRASAPMLSMTLFRSRGFAAGNASTFLFFASLYGSTFFLAQFLQTAQGDGPLEAGLRLLPWTLLLFLTAPLSGALINRFGERRIIVGALLAQSIAMVWLALIVSPHVAYGALIPPLMLAGLASAFMPAAQSAVINSVQRGAIGKASGMYNMLRQIGAAFGVAILAAVFAHGGSYSSPQAFTSGFSPALVVSAALSLTAALAALLLPARRAATVATATAPDAPPAAAEVAPAVAQ